MTALPDLVDVGAIDTAEARKARGAFFTPPSVTRHLVRWAIRDKEDAVLEPSAGDAAFLVEAVRRLQELGTSSPSVDGVEIHAESAAAARARVVASGGSASVQVADFFTVEPAARYDAVVGNPPFIRYQGFTGESRGLARRAALRAGVSLTALASSWAAFTVHSALFLRRGGRLALVLPAELLSVNYAAAVRAFLFSRFRDVRLVLFAQQVFAGAEADTLLLLADGYEEGPTDHATVRQVSSAADLEQDGFVSRWTPANPAEKWTALLAPDEAVEVLTDATRDGVVGPLEEWGDTTLGAVTGNNAFFTMAPERARTLQLADTDLVPLCPPGSTHLRGALDLDAEALAGLGRLGRSTALFSPAAPLSASARRYILGGEQSGVDQAYKCRVRRTWYQVPLLPPADLLLTCMNADTPRLIANSSGARHLNSVHGVYLGALSRRLGQQFLPFASLNSLTLLGAEIVGRSYGGGILKLEPREADVWPVPTASTVEARGTALNRVKPAVEAALAARRLDAAVELVDEALLLGSGLLTRGQLDVVRGGRKQMSDRRTTRGRRGR